MKALALPLVLALAGCPPPPRYAVVQVTTPMPEGNAPVGDAMVAAICGKAPATRSSATRTDDLGRARLSMSGRMDAATCSLVVAKPGYATAEGGSVSVCDTPNQCPPTYVELPREGAR